MVMNRIKQYINNIRQKMTNKYYTWNEYKDLLILTDHILFMSNTTQQSYNNIIKSAKMRAKALYTTLYIGLLLVVDHTLSLVLKLVNEVKRVNKEGYIFVNNRRVL